MKEQTIFIQSKTKLEAVLTTPEQETNKAFLIVSGSGKGDLDGNFKSLKLNIYKYLSDFLVEKGYATLRYNKRGVGKSEGNFKSLGLYDLLDDLDANIQYLKDNYKKVYILGHSEGSILATLYSEKHDVDGLILMSGAGVDLKTALNFQQQNTLNEIANLKGFKGWLLRLLVKEEKLWKQQNKFYKKIEESEKDTIRVQLIPVQAKWMREHFKYNKLDIQNILTNLKCPTLAITGTKDVQADVKDLDEVEQLNNPNIEISKVPNMTHMLRELDKEISMLNLKAQYTGDIQKPLTTQLLSRLTEWLDKLDK